MSEVAQSCLTLCDPVDCSLPGFSVHGILQVRVLEWVTISFSRGSSDPGIKPGSPTLEADTLTSEPPGKPRDVMVSDKLVILTVGLITLRNDHFFKTFFIFPIWNMFVPFITWLMSSGLSKLLFTILISSELSL